MPAFEEAIDMRTSCGQPTRPDSSGSGAEGNRAGTQTSIDADSA